MRIVHEGRGGYVELEGERYAIEHVADGRFCIHVPRGGRAAHVEALMRLAAEDPTRWTIERR